MSPCPRCGGSMIGDGYTVVPHCENSEAEIGDREPDSEPVYCEPVIQRLTQRPTAGRPQTYVTIHEGIGGWNSGVWSWQPGFALNGDEEPDHGFYEPQQTGFTNTSIGDGRRESAIAEAENWAESEDLPLWIPERKDEHQQDI